MRVAIEYERAARRAWADVHEKNLGYDLTSLDTESGAFRLIEVKGLAGSEGPIIVTPNEHRVAEDRRECYWLYVVTDATEQPKLRAYKDPARFGWCEVTQVAHYTLPAGALRRQGESGNPSDPAGGDGR
jgi:NAD-dependent oxidoreductase involved in siderophore biosynthesis